LCLSAVACRFELLTQPTSEGHDPNLVTIGEGWNKDGLVESFGFRHNSLYTTTDGIRALIPAYKAQIQLVITREQDPELLKPLRERDRELYIG